MGETLDKNAKVWGLVYFKVGAMGGEKVVDCFLVDFEIRNGHTTHYRLRLIVDPPSFS